MRIGDSGGILVASNYNLHFSTTATAATSYVGDGDNSSARWRLTSGIGNATGEGFNGVYFLHRDTSIYNYVHGTFSMSTGTTGVYQGGQFFGIYADVVTMDRIQIVANVGTLTSGRFTVWGISHV